MKAEARKQINISASEALRDKLDDLARRFGKRSKSEVALEIVENYVDFYDEAETSRINTLNNQRAAALNKGGAVERKYAQVENLSGKNLNDVQLDEFELGKPLSNVDENVA